MNNCKVRGAVMINGSVSKICGNSVAFPINNFLVDTNDIYSLLKTDLKNL